MVSFVIFETWLILAGLAFIVTYRLLTGKINLRWLLYEDSATGKYSPGRVQLLVVTIASSSYYLLQTLHDPSRFPVIPPELVLVTGGGNLIYLIGKFSSLLRNMKP
jgi:hypothetical protein